MWTSCSGAGPLATTVSLRRAGQREPRCNQQGDLGFGWRMGRARRAGQRRVGKGGGKATYDRTDGVLVERIPADGHDHRIHHPLTSTAASASASPCTFPSVPGPVRERRHLITTTPPLLNCSRLSPQIPIPIKIQPRKTIINPALNVLVPADGEAGDGDVGGRDAELPWSVSCRLLWWPFSGRAESRGGGCGRSSSGEKGLSGAEGRRERSSSGEGASGDGQNSGGAKKRREDQVRTSELPLPKPLITFPFSRRG